MYMNEDDDEQAHTRVNVRARARLNALNVAQTQEHNERKALSFVEMLDKDERV